MSSYTLNIQVDGGNISSDCNRLTADSVDYIVANFNFDESWNFFYKTAIFRVGELVYHVPLDDNTCKIPFEVLKEPIMHISVFGVVNAIRATTTELTIHVQSSGYTICEPSAPTPDPYNYFIERVTELKNEATASVEQCKNYVEDAQKAGEDIADLTESAISAGNLAEKSCSEARKSETASAEALQHIRNIENTVSEQSESVKQNTNLALNAAENAQKTAMLQVENHNKYDNYLAHPNIVEIAENAKSIALGKANSLCFATEEQLRQWVEGKHTRDDKKTVSDLKTGDNLYILELGVPDYWWDGANIQPLGAEKPDFSDYYTKNQIDAKITNASLELISREDYDFLYQSGGLDVGKVYFVF